MVSIASFKTLALRFPGVTERPHFEKLSYRVNKKIFATLDIENKRACVKLNATDQDLCCLVDKQTIYPVNNKWGKQGWTLIELNNISKSLLQEIIGVAFETVHPTKKK